MSALTSCSWSGLMSILPILPSIRVAWNVHREPCLIGKFIIIWFSFPDHLLLSLCLSSPWVREESNHACLRSEQNNSCVLNKSANSNTSLLCSILLSTPVLSYPPIWHPFSELTFNVLGIKHAIRLLLASQPSCSSSLLVSYWLTDTHHFLPYFIFFYI